MRPVGREGGRGAHGPAPVSASLYRLRRQTALRGTVSPSSRRRVGGMDGPLCGHVREGEFRLHSHPDPPPLCTSRADRSFPQSAHVRSAWALAGRLCPAARQSPSAWVGQVARSHPPAKSPPLPSARGTCSVLSSGYRWLALSSRHEGAAVLPWGVRRWCRQSGSLQESRSESRGAGSGAGKRSEPPMHVGRGIAGPPEGSPRRSRGAKR